MAGIAILCDRPDQIELDNRGRLHCETGPAVRYPDGWGVYAIHGVRVPEYVIVRPYEITIEDIETETNQEIMRIKIKCYGAMRYMLDSGAKLVHADEYGELYRKDRPDLPPMLMVKVINGTPDVDGGRKEYWLRVHPQLQPMLRRDEGGQPRYGRPQEFTAKAAVASTYGMTAEEYAPTVRT